MLKLEARSSESYQGAQRSLSRSFVRVICAVVVLAGVCLMWLTLLVIFAPWVVLADLIRLLRGKTLAPADENIVTAGARASGDVPLIFDRRGDVSKLYGCNTRNVRYRWSLFAERLNRLKNAFEHPKALDFGAGSLRDSYELAERGFEVVSFDLNDRVLRHYLNSYNWTAARRAPRLLAGSLEDLENDFAASSLQLVLAFDVIEHLEDPAPYVQGLARLLGEQGFLFTIVPNKRSRFERYFQRTLAEQRKKGIPLEPGVPHVQFKSPEEWDQFFEANGFRVVDRDMTIGYFVNDWWNGLAVPLRTYVYPVLQVVAYYGKFEIDAGRIEATLCPRWLMERVNLLDQFFKNWLSHRFGWNLIVAQKVVT